MALLDDLQALRTRLRSVSAQFEAHGDIDSSQRVDTVVLTVEDAIRMAQARDIIAGLPSDADAATAAAMLADMGQVATHITADRAAVTKFVSMATQVVDIVSDLSLGQYAAAAANAGDLRAALG